MVSQLLVSPSVTPLRGSVPVPADPVVSMIALGVAALTSGASRLELPHVPEPVGALASALRLCGLEVEQAAAGLTLHGRGLFGLQAPAQVLDARGAPLAASILAGLLVSRPFESSLIVDEAWAEEVLPALGHAHQLSAEPLEGGGLDVRFGATDERPAGAQLRLGGARCWAKVALLLGALRAGSPTSLLESVISADHCERLLHHLRIPLDASGVTITLHPPRDAEALSAFELPHVGDLSAAAYLAAAAAIVPGSHVTMRGVGLNPTRAALLQALRGVGVQAGITPGGDVLSEPSGELTVYGQVVRGGAVAGETGARLGDDFIPVAVLAAGAEGGLQLGDWLPGGGAFGGSGLRDVARVVGLLRAFGLDAVPAEAGLSVSAHSGALRATRVTTGGDHRLALAATVLALRADGPSWVDYVECVLRFFPRWVGTLRALGAELEVRQLEVRQ